MSFSHHQVEEVPPVRNRYTSGVVVVEIFPIQYVSVIVIVCLVYDRRNGRLDETTKEETFGV